MHLTRFGEGAGPRVEDGTIRLLDAEGNGGVVDASGATVEDVLTEADGAYAFPNLVPEVYEIDDYQAGADALVTLVGKLYQRGIPIVPGTDHIAGFTLHRERELYSQAGIPNISVLGIATLGFYIDSAIADIRLDRVMLLLLVTALLNLGIDALSRLIRSRLRLSTRVSSCSD